MQLPEALRLYRTLGWDVVRIPPTSKAPIDPDWPKRQYPDSAFSLGDNVGVKTGQPSGGLVDIDLDCPEAIAIAPTILPPTCVFGRRGAGKTPGVALEWHEVDTRRHWLYRVPQGVASQKPTRTHVELRSTGLQTVFPGSVHESGDVVEWVQWPDGSPTIMTPERVLALFGKLAFATCLARIWPTVVGDRHHLLLSLSGALWHKGWTLEDAEQVILTAVNLDGKHEPHRQGTLRSTWEPDDKNRLGWPAVEQILNPPDLAVLQRHCDLVPTVPRHTPDVIAANLHDTGNAERLLSLYGEELIHVQGVGWLQWSQTRWAPAEPAPHAIAAARHMLTATTDAGDLPGQKWAHQSLSQGRIQACIALAEQIDNRVTVETLDSDSWLLNCQNGTVDLRTGRLLSHDRSHYITRQCPVAYDPEAVAPRFVQFLHEVFGGDYELVQYIVRYLGYCLTGDVREQCVGVWYGQGSNGKSTLIDVILSIMGEYAQKMSGDLLTAAKTRSSSGPSPDVARLRGVRLAAGAEVGEGQRWDEPLLKTLTGGDRVVARHLHQEPIEFAPTWKLILAVNHKPLVRGTDHGIWRRIHLIPFEQKFDGAQIDKQLGAKLAAEYAGILTLLVQGCVAWQAHGLGVPSKLRVAVAEYRSEHDTIGAFFAESTRQKYGAVTPKGVLYRTYRSWAQENGEFVLGRTTFIRLVRERRIAESDSYYMDLEITTGF